MWTWTYHTWILQALLTFHEGQQLVQSQGVLRLSREDQPELGKSLFWHAVLSITSAFLHE